MGRLFWFRRFLRVLCIAFMVIVAAHLLRGYELIDSLTQSTVLAIISATIFVISRIYQSRKGQHVRFANDIPELRDSR